MKKVSVIIPAYNAEKFIENCLESIAAQTFNDYELIVSDDGSTDHTADKTKEFIAKHPELDIKMINHPNGGVSLARKRALEIATGEWVTFVDADDTLPKKAIEELVSLSGDDTDLVVGGIYPPQFADNQLYKPILWQNAILLGHISQAVWGKLYRRTLLTPSMLDIPRRITIGEDALMNIAYSFAMAKPPKLTSAHIYNYTMNPSSVTHTVKRDLDYEYFYDSWRLKMIPEGRQEEFMKSITQNRLNGLLSCLYSDLDTLAQKTHPFFGIIREGIKQSGYKVSPFEWIALNVKSPYILRLTAFIRMIFIALGCRLSRLNSKLRGNV